MSTTVAPYSEDCAAGQIDDLTFLSSLAEIVFSGGKQSVQLGHYIRFFKFTVWLRAERTYSDNSNVMDQFLVYLEVGHKVPHWILLSVSK
jgi:hypothetical protein